MAGGADVRYHVTPGGVKEEIVLHEPPEAAEWIFDLDVGGLSAHELGDGSVAFFDLDGGVEPVFTIPRPFMLDNADDPGSADGQAWSDAVSQSVSQEGSVVTLTVTADGEWLASDERRYPVAIDPTIVVEPTPTQGRDAMIREAAPSTNYGQSWQLGVGTDSSGAARSLLWFDVSWLPPGTPIDSAELQMWYDQAYSTNAYDVPIQVLPATASWDESTVTWNSFTGDNAAATSVVVDNGDSGTSWSGSWPESTSSLTQYAVDEDYQFNKNSTPGESYSWVPDVPTSGDYDVEVHYVRGSDRAPAAPYAVHHADGQDTVTVDQTVGSGGEWVRLGRYRFGAGTGHEIVLGDVTNSNDAVIADAVRLTDAAGQIKSQYVNSVWHRFEVRDLVTDWVDGEQDNHGFMLRAADESTLGRGGASYEAAEYAYNGGPHTNRPKLVITYGEPGAELDPITTTRATGAELSWSAYDGDDIAEYEIHKAVWQRFTPTSSTLIDTVEPGSTTFTDTTAEPTPIDDPAPSGDAFYYQVAVRTVDGDLIPGSTQLVRLPKEGQISKVIDGAVDTTLSDAHPDTNFDVFENEPWLSVGDNGGSFGVTRTLVKFPDLADEIPSGTTVYNADLKLWKPMTFGSGERHDIHALTREFDETTATWDEAADGVPWDTPGGDFDPQVVDYVPTVGQSPRFHVWWIDDLVAQWVNNPSTNHGALIKTENESANQLTVFDSAELASEPLLRPQLHVTYEATEPPPNEPPAAPDNPHTTSPATECVTEQDRPLIRDATPVLRATLSDPDGDDVQAGFGVFEVASGSEVWAPPLTDAAPSGSEHTVTVPDGVLEDGMSYRWRVHGLDVHGLQGPHTDCEFTIDLTAPDATPGVAPVPGEPAEYHEGETAGGVGVAGKFEFTNGGVADVVSYDYSFNSETLDDDVTVASGATVSFTPAMTGEHTLRVRSVDQAGWAGPVRTYVFTVADTPDPDGHTWTYSYDADGQRTSVVDPLGNETTSSYDRAGRLTGETDANGHTTGYTYDALDRLVEVTGPDSAVTTYTYNTAGDLVSRTDPNDHVTTYAYDQLHQLIDVTDPLDRVTGYSYDPEGNLAQTTTARGLVIDNTHDPRGLLLGVDTGDQASSTTYAYDTSGRRTSATTATGTMTMTYDDASRLIEVSDGTNTYTYGYNSRGLVTSRNYPDGRTAATAYDADGRQVEQTVGGVPAQFDYDPDGNLALVEHPGGVMTQAVEYDPAGRVTSMLATSTTGASTSIDYAYDPTGNPTQATTIRNGTVSTESYLYDQANRLTRVCYSDQANPQDCSDTAASTIGYSYDLVGNRLAESRVGVDNPGDLTYTYDAADQVLSRGTESYSYDADGNQTGAGNTTRVFDALNRLVEVATGAELVTLGYDALGNRSTVTAGASATTFEWDINASLPVLVGFGQDGTTTSYRYDPAGRPLSADIGGSEYLLAADALGSVTDMIDPSTGGLAWHTSYEPFGTPRDTAETIPGTPAAGLGYTGAYTDPTIDLVHLRARDYNPATGRFTTVDPVTPQLDDPCVASYVYVNNQPTVLTDPSGACPWCDEFALWADQQGRSLISTVEEEGPPSSRFELFGGITTGGVRAGEDIALSLTPFGDSRFNEAIGWDGRLLADRLEEAAIAARMNPTWYCGASLVGEFGTYIGAAVAGPAAIRSATTSINRLLKRFADDAANAGSKLLPKVDSAFQFPGAGRSGAGVKNFVGPPNTIARGASPGRVFVTDEKGRVIFDVTRDRVKPVVPGQGFVSGDGRKLTPTAEQLSWIDELWGG